MHLSVEPIGLIATRPVSRAVTQPPTAHSPPHSKSRFLVEEEEAAAAAEQAVKAIVEYTDKAYGE